MFVVSVRTANSTAGDEMPRVGSSRALRGWVWKYFAAWRATIEAALSLAMKLERSHMPQSFRISFTEADRICRLASEQSQQSALRLGPPSPKRLLVEARDPRTGAALMGSPLAQPDALLRLRTAFTVIWGIEDVGEFAKLTSTEYSVTGLDLARVSDLNRMVFESQLMQFAEKHSGTMSSTGPLLTYSGAGIFNYAIELKDQHGSAKHFFHVDGPVLQYMPAKQGGAEDKSIRIELSRPAAMADTDKMFQSIGQSLQARAASQRSPLPTTHKVRAQSAHI